ncbi:FAD:protein FMN transferase [Rhodopirellula baltica]|uniref:FAD:protein FMN transferase n=1 Tax=Rhodopirellula baltica SWK14 TaxID=993516 RepID=L7CG18_RHOBT|nr:ApbE family lipoprotein [Rhodopirellula baltica SWK14]
MDLLEMKHRAMACDFVVLVPDENQRVGNRSAADAVLRHLEAIEEIESSLTVYRGDSEIARVNALAYEKPVHLKPATFELLQKANALAERTQGAFDITAGPLVETWGFTKREGRKPKPDEIESARERVGWKRLILDVESRTARFAVEGMSLNMGAIGKGHAIDVLAASMRSDGMCDFLIHAGHSSVLAAGDQQPVATSDENEVEHDSERPKGWLVGVSHPTRPGKRLGGLWLRDEALSTSGSGKQFFHHQGKRYGHVIDPRTGYPAGQWLSLTLTTTHAVDADALSTALFVMGKDEAKAYAAEHGIGLILVSAGKRQEEVVLDKSGPLIWHNT